MTHRLPLRITGRITARVLTPIEENKNYRILLLKEKEEKEKPQYPNSPIKISLDICRISPTPKNHDRLAFPLVCRVQQNCYFKRR